MFNGIIFNQCIVKKIKKRSKGLNIFISSKIKLSQKDLGSSIACDGVCLTLISVKNKLYEFYLSNEKNLNYLSLPKENNSNVVDFLQHLRNKKERENN